jgi:hypothetical protein
MNKAIRSNHALVVLWGFILFTTAYFIIEGLKVITEPLSKVIVAVLTGLFVLIGAYLTHVLANQREREVEQIRRKQERYAQILEGLVPYIRSKGAKADEFAVPVLHAYVVGEKRVASAIACFLNKRTSENLDAIIRSMREDLGMENLEEGTTTKNLLPEPKHDEPGTI